MTELTAILADLEIAIRLEDFYQPEPLPGDKWIIASALQKSIRRGEITCAMQAAKSLWYQDRASFWRRLHIAAVEDVGIGDTEAVVKTLTATSAFSWRRRIGDLRCGLFLTQLLCKAVKSRAGDELYLQIERSSTHADMRQRLAKADNDLLQAYILDSNETLENRAIALWYMAGTQKFTSDLMPARKGSTEQAIATLRMLAIPQQILESCISVLHRTQWPLALLTPLIYDWHQQEDSGKNEILFTDFPPSKEVDGVPLYAADMFTRVGQASFRQLQKTLPELQCFTIRQIGVAVFFLEGGSLDKTLSSPALETLRMKGEMADAEGAGLELLDYMQLRDCLSTNARVLEATREEQLRRYFYGATA